MKLNFRVIKLLYIYKKKIFFIKLIESKYLNIEKKVYLFTINFDFTYFLYIYIF